MKYSKDIVKNLYQKIYQNDTENRYALTLYVPVDKSSKKDIRHLVKIYLEDILNEMETLKGNDEIFSILLSEIEKQLDGLSQLEHGVAVFLTFPKDLHFMKKSVAPQEVTCSIYQLPFPPQKDTYIGNEFRIEQLLKIFQETFSASAIVYTLSDYAIFHITPLTITPALRVAASAAMEPTKGLGEYREANRKETSTIDTVIESMKDFKTIMKDTIEEFLVCFYTTGFSEEMIQKHLEQFLPEKTHVILEARGITDEDKIFQIVQKLIRSKQESLIETQIENLKENKNLLAQLISDIFTAIIEQNGETLYVRDDAIITRNDLSDALKKSIPALNEIKNDKDILPWLIRKTIESGGDVLFVSPLYQTEALLLKLRFTV